MSELVQWPMARYWHRAWNPVIGCRAVSPACEHCWARGWADRFKRDFEPFEGGAKTPPRKGVVFVGNMTDMWGEWATGTPFYLGEAVGAAMREGAKLTFLWLTKRAGRMAAMLDALPLPHISRDMLSPQYFGFTAENQEWFAKRGMEVLKNFPKWANLWVSMEPLLGPIEAPITGLSPLPKWVVVGCESGPHRRPCKVEWVERIVEQCRSAGVPVFVKQLDLGGKCVTDIERFPEHLRIRQVPWKSWKL